MLRQSCVTWLILCSWLLDLRDDRVDDALIFERIGIRDTAASYRDDLECVPGGMHHVQVAAALRRAVSSVPVGDGSRERRAASATAILVA